ncbi:MAG TPA: hypothetical protein VJ696_10300 [Rhodanobacteraceae bacterium]|nr:hypothetical protein [Rhodanobacteraceae bacterium]
MIIDQGAQPCARKGCACEVPAGQTYCSPHCANASVENVAEASASTCGCGHESCGSGVETEARGAGL